jgi:hypothetical protein
LKYGRTVVGDEPGGMLEKVSVAYFKLLSLRLFTVATENQKSISD